MSNKLTQMAHDLLSIEADLPYRFVFDTDRRRNEYPHVDDFTFECRDIDGQNIVIANPITTEQPIFVYCKNAFCYCANLKDKFMQDLNNKTLELDPSKGNAKYN